MAWKRPSYAGGNGGITHDDRGAIEYLHSIGCTTLLDVGCSTGTQVQHALDLGMGAFGIDVDETVIGNVQNCALINLCIKPVVFHKPFDVVWSVEVAEHIPEEFADKYIKTLTQNCDKYIVMTASDVPGGVHLNPQPLQYWIDKIEPYGFTESKSLKDGILNMSTMKREFLEKNGIFFKNNCLQNTKNVV